MCIIGIAKTRMLTDTEIDNCFQNNSDGAGFAWAENNKVHVIKGLMTLDAFYAAYQTHIVDQDIIQHVVHFRTSTAGGVSQELTHPFVIEADSRPFMRGEFDKSVLFHNGCVFDWSGLYLNMVTSGQLSMHPEGEEMSDTRLAAMMTSVLGNDVLKYLAGKYVLIDPTGFIVRYGDFADENGILFSNTGHKSVIYTYNKGGCVNNRGWKGGKKNDWYERWQKEHPDQRYQEYD